VVLLFGSAIFILETAGACLGAAQTEMHHWLYPVINATRWFVRAAFIGKRLGRLARKSKIYIRV